MSSLRLGDIAPDFEQDSSLGPIHFHQLGLTAKLKDEFAKRGVKVIALSVDPVESHKKWIEDINASQHTTVSVETL